MPEDYDWFVFALRMRLRGEAVSCGAWMNTMKNLMVSFYLQFSVFLSACLFKGKCGLGESERQHHPQGFKARTILCITVLKPWAVNEHTTLGVCCFEWLVDTWNCPRKAEYFWLGHLFLADTYKFTTFIAMRNYLGSQGGRWVMCVNKWSTASF